MRIGNYRKCNLTMNGKLRNRSLTMRMEITEFLRKIDGFAFSVYLNSTCIQYELYLNWVVYTRGVLAVGREIQEIEAVRVFID